MSAFGFNGAPGVDRRQFLGGGALALGSLALRHLDWRRQSGAGPGLHHAPRAKRVIYLYMAGGPSQLESFDPKPRLRELDGQPMPASMTAGNPVAQLQGRPLMCRGPRVEFRPRGESGLEVSDHFPELGRAADRLCVVRSMHTDSINHDSAHTLMNTGSAISGRPSFGSWMHYGLGYEADELPGFVVLMSLGASGQMQPVASRNWHSGFLPGEHQGVRLRGGSQPVPYLNREPGISADRQQRVIEAVRDLDRIAAERSGDDALATRALQYELAARMQVSVPDVVDLTRESPASLAAYGVERLDGSFAANCLLARRLVERGVPFVQVYHRGWDHHSGIEQGMNVASREVDRPAAALLEDLDQRGLLEDTLVVWGGEFGRTPMAQGSGRDHHIRAFSYWLAGGGVRGGTSHGSTDELGYDIATDPVHVNDLHATLLHQLGFDHLRLTFRHQGRDYRLTDVGGRVVEELLA